MLQIALSPRSQLLQARFHLHDRPGWPVDLNEGVGLATESRWFHQQNGTSDVGSRHVKDFGIYFPNFSMILKNLEGGIGGTRNRKHGPRLAEARKNHKQISYNRKLHF